MSGSEKVENNHRAGALLYTAAFPAATSLRKY